MKDHIDVAIDSWKTSRSGAWAGRGFHYQHLVSTLILIRQWAGLDPSGFLVPEGFDDCVLELSDGDIWLQIKSRKDSTFGIVEAQKILADTRMKADAAEGVNKNYAAVVLEQPRTGCNEAGVERIFRRDEPCIFVCAEPGEDCEKLISTQLGTAEIIARGVVDDLYRLVAEVSQENASLPFEQRRRISTTEVERRIFERLEAEDPSSIDRAMVSGSLQPVDFTSAINEPAFYRGVKVAPGHVAAGLVFDRIADTAAVVKALRQRRHVVLTGQSGAGKSALLWLAAGQLAGEFRWYQITGRALSADADAIIRFVRARCPTETSPIGLAFDDIDSANYDLWNVLVRELRGMPEVYFLGSMRHEDVSVVANQADTVFIKVSLDKKLAESIWQRLRADKQTNWDHWLEPFEQSKGLMLEFVHVLTQGQRLQAVIDEQMRRRLQEMRFDELALIRSTAVICARGGEVQASKLFELLGLKKEDASSALTRLLDEHLIQESRPGVLGGLHMLRSKALVMASHDETAFLSEDTFWQSLPAVTASTLPAMVRSIVAHAQDQNETDALRRLAKMLGDCVELEIWIGILTGLGLATLERQVSLFMGVLEQHGVPRAQWSLASMFVDPDIDIPELPEFEDFHILRDSVHNFRALPKNDLRPACLQYLPKGNVVPSCRDLRQANRLFSCLTPICGGSAVPLPNTPSICGEKEQDIGEVASLLSTAYLLGPETAKNLAQAFGGESVLLGWFRSQTPWVTAPVIDSNGSHGRTVRSDWHHVAEGKQPDPHETICRICETLIAISPDSDAAASDAVNPVGHPITVGDIKPWSKNMPRRNLPAKAHVAWNVAFRQILLARSASDNLTDYTRQMVELVRRSEKVFRAFTEKWIKGKHVANAETLAEQVNEIVQAVNALAYAAPEKPKSEMTAPATSAGSDDTLGSLLTGVLGNLMSRISESPGEGSKGTATFAASLAAQAHDHEHSAIWRTSPKPPYRELGALKERLGDVACILHEMAYDGGQSSIQGIIQAARKGGLSKAIRSAARRCQSVADQRFRKRLKDLQSTLVDKGWNARCVSRPIDDLDSVCWPAREVAILVEIAGFEMDANYVEECLAAGANHLGNDWRYRVVPVLNDYVIPALAMVPSSNAPLPDLDFAKDWQSSIDSTFLVSEIVDKFDRAMTACFQLSGISTCCNPKSLHPDEYDLYSQSLKSFEQNHDQVAKAAEEKNLEQLAWALDYLNNTWNKVNDEIEAAKVGQSVSSPLCMIPYLGLAGETNDQSLELAALRLLLLQAECAQLANDSVRDDKVNTYH